MMDDDLTVDDTTYEALAREAPILVRLRRFSESLKEANWFAKLGERPGARVREAADAYLDRLGFPEASLSILPTWEDAADAAETNDWSSPGWEAEELLRADLTANALDVVSEEALDIGLRLVAREVADAAKAAMEEQAALWDVVDEAAQNLAVGAAAQAANGAALLLVAAAANPDIEPDDHAFAWKLRIFELGRWPVALVGGTFSVF